MKRAVVTGSPTKAALLRSLFSGLGNQYAGTLVTGLGQLIVTAALARLLTPEDYGLVGLAAVISAWPPSSLNSASALR